MRGTLRTADSDNLGVGASQFLTVPNNGAEDGDLLVANVSFDGGSGVTITPPDGWTLARRLDAASDFGLAVYYRVADNEPGTWIWDMGASVQCAGAVAAYTNRDIWSPVEGDAGTFTPAAGAYDVPAIEVATPDAIVVMCAAGDASTAFTPPAPYALRAEHSQVNVAAMIADRQFDGPAAIAAASLSVSVMVDGLTHLLVLRPSAGVLTRDDVRENVVGLLPPGARDLYDLGTSSSIVYNLFDAVAACLKQYGFDYVDLLRLEINPATCFQKLPDWERVFGMAARGTVLQRINAVISRLRESGASTRPLIRAIVGPLLGYVDPSALEIIECSRSALDALTAYFWPTGAIPGAGDYNEVVAVGDAANVSQAGVRMELYITHADVSQLLFALTAPTGEQKQWSLPPGAAAGDLFVLRSPFHAGVPITGNWNLIISNSGAGGTVDGGSLIRVDGIGRDARGIDALGAEIFKYAVLSDPALEGVNGNAPDFVAARAAIARLNPSHCQGYLVRAMDGGGNYAIVDDPNCIVDMCIVGT